MEKERLTIEQRMLIEQLLMRNYKLKDISKAVHKNESTISREIKQRIICNENNKNICDKTNRYPFICTGYKNKYNYKKRKYYYRYNKDQEDYLLKLKYSRQGIDMSIDEIDYWNDFFINLQLLDLLPIIKFI